MTKPKAVISDNHAHDWDAFSKILPSGVNSRLQHILDEINHAADNLIAAGGDTMYFGGDLFHVRGKVPPSVSNPLIDCFVGLAMRGVKSRILTGNHDLQSRDSNALSSACETLRTVPDCEIVSQPTVFWDDKVVMIPWYDKTEDIAAQIQILADGISKGTITPDEPPQLLSEFDLIIHAPVNGVILGIPDHGFYPAQLAAYGFKHVFSGHYHSHKRFEEGKVVSIGASTHQTWNDVGTLAGHMIVDDKGPTFFESQAPKFIDYDLAWDIDEAEKKVKGNFVRVVMGEATPDEVDFIREHVMALDAGGCVINAIPVPKGTVVARAVGTSVASAPSTRESVADWIEEDLKGKDPAIIKAAQELAAKILDETEALEA